MKNLICALTVLLFLANSGCDKNKENKKSDSIEKVGSFEVIFKKPSDNGLIAEFDGETLERDILIRGVANYENLMEQKKSFEMAAAYRQIEQDFAGESIRIDFFMDKPKRDLSALLTMVNSEPKSNIEVAFKGPGDDKSLVAQVNDKKYFTKDLNLNHTTYLQIEKQLHDAIMSKVWESITYLALKKEADSQGMKTKDYLEKNQLMKAQVASDDEVKAFLAGINAKLSEINEVQFERFRAVVTQRNQDDKIRGFIAKNIIKKPIVVYLEKPDQSIQVAGLSGGAKGPEDAPVEMQLFTDLLCDNCKVMWNTVQGARDKYPEQIRLSLVHQYENNDLFGVFVAEASQCVKDQGEHHFWKFVKFIQESPEPVDEKVMNETVEMIGANLEDFKKCALSRKHQAEVAKQNQLAKSFGFYRVPNLVVNGKVFMGVAPAEEVEAIIKENYRKRSSGGFFASLWQKISSIF